MADQDFHFILFISGMSVKSGRAIENINRICSKHFQKRFKLQIIDINKERAKAVEFPVFAIPTLLKTKPHPPRMIIGDLSDEEKVLRMLEFN